MKNYIPRQAIWLRTVRKYQKSVEASSTNTFLKKSLSKKLDILRRKILKMNRVWRLGIATASLIAWFNAPALAQFPANIDLSTLSSSTIEGRLIRGALGDDRAGQRVASAGDINGDGINDILIGANVNASNSQYEGVTYVIFGSSTGFPANLNQSSLTGSNGFIINGIDPNDFSGGALASAGDVNGDGIDDIIVGASNATPSPNGILSRFRAGETYVVFGNSAGFTSSFDLSSLGGNTGFTVEGYSQNDNLGASVASAGDINGDGIDDVIIGAPGSSSAGANAGESHIIFGSSTGFPSNFNAFNLAASGTGFAFFGNVDDESGASVASAGDVNGDGIDDIIIGAPSRAYANGVNTGKAYVIFGNATGFSSNLSPANLTGSNGFVLNGVNDEDQLGSSVASAGDINGDGIDDMIIGAYNADPNGLSDAGVSYVVFGSTAGFSASFDLSSLTGSNGFVINGLTANSRLGSSVASAEDMNGDGINDILIGAPQTSSSAGAIYIIFGRATGFSASFDLSNLTGLNGFVLNGDNSSQSGTSVASAGDVNADGLDDLVIGAPQSPFFSIKGETFLVFGRQCSSATPTVSITVSPTQVQEGNSGSASSSITYTFSASVSQTCSDMIVNFSVSGSASASTDYTLSGATTFDPSTGLGTVTIFKGDTTTSLNVTPIGDFITEPDETVIVTIMP